MHQLREYSQRTEDNLSRLITGVDKLAQDLPRRLASAAPEIPAMGAAPRPAHSKPLKRRVHHANRMPKIVAAILGAILVLALGIWGAGKFTGHANSAPADPNNTATKPDKSKVAPPPSTADTKTKLQAAQQYVDQKDYPMAEDLYKQVLNSEPTNAEALQALASVLYREDKVDEAAATLDRLQK